MATAKPKAVAAPAREPGKARARHGGEGHWVMIEEADGRWHHVYIKGPRPAGGKPARPPWHQHKAELARSKRYGRLQAHTPAEQGELGAVRKLAAIKKRNRRAELGATVATVGPKAVVLKASTRELLAKHRRPAEPVSARTMDWLHYPAATSSYRPAGSGKTQVRTKNLGGRGFPDRIIHTVTGRDALGRAVKVGVPTERQARAVQGIYKAGGSARAIDRVVMNQSYTPERSALATTLKAKRTAAASSKAPARASLHAAVAAHRASKGLSSRDRARKAESLWEQRRVEREAYAAGKVMGQGGSKRVHLGELRAKVGAEPEVFGRAVFRMARRGGASLYGLDNPRERKGREVYMTPGGSERHVAYVGGQSSSGKNALERLAGKVSALKTIPPKARARATLREQVEVHRAKKGTRVQRAYALASKAQGMRNRLIERFMEPIPGYYNAKENKRLAAVGSHLKKRGAALAARQARLDLISRRHKP